MSRNIERQVWNGMKHRCTNPKAGSYKYYGGKGIKVCPEWTSFEQFYADMGPRPTAKHSIDRINSDGDYEPSNCRWATQEEQHMNRSNAILVNDNGTTMILSQYCRKYGYNYRRTVKRVQDYKMPLEQAILPDAKIPSLDNNSRSSLNHYSKLSADDVRAIRSLKGQMKHAEIARLYGVTDDHITNIINRNKWRSVA